MTKLPDYINPGVTVLFVGINPGLRSATVGHHFAGYSNRFWKLLSESKLVPLTLTYQDDWRLPQWGVGLTNIVSRPTSGSNDLTPKDYKIGRARLAAKIRKNRISIITLLGVTIYPVLFPRLPNRGHQTEQKPENHADRRSRDIQQEGRLEDQNQVQENRCRRSHRLKSSARRVVCD